MSYKLFLSHSGLDSGWAKWVAQSSVAVGLEVYMFEHDPRPGTEVAAKIKRGIQDSDALVVLLTPAGQSSSYVQQEVGYAEASKKLIVPLVWPGAQKPSLAMLEGREYVSFDPHNPAASISPLLAYLQKLKAEKEAALAIVALVALFVGAVALGR